MINFDISKDDTMLIFQIAKKVQALAKEVDVVYDRTTIIMDLTACHANSVKLDLPLLLKWGEEGAPDFGHDVFGIRRFMNRDTGKLENCFVPRCGRPS